MSIESIPQYEQSINSPEPPEPTEPDVSQSRSNSDTKSNTPVGSFRSPSLRQKAKSQRTTFRAGDKHKKKSSFTSPLPEHSILQETIPYEEPTTTGIPSKRTVSLSPHLITMSDTKGSKKESLEEVLAHHNKRHNALCPTNEEARNTTRWFLDQFFIKMTVSKRRTRAFRTLLPLRPLRSAERVNRGRDS